VRERRHGEWSRAQACMALALLHLHLSCHCRTPPRGWSARRRSWCRYPSRTAASTKPRSSVSASRASTGACQARRSPPQIDQIAGVCAHPIAAAAAAVAAAASAHPTSPCRLLQHHWQLPVRLRLHKRPWLQLPQPAAGHPGVPAENARLCLVPAHRAPHAVQWRAVRGERGQVGVLTVLTHVAFGWLCSQLLVSVNKGSTGCLHLAGVMMPLCLPRNCIFCAFRTSFHCRPALSACACSMPRRLATVRTASTPSSPPVVGPRVPSSQPASRELLVLYCCLPSCR